MKNGIAAAIRAHWKQFAWIWVFPVILFCSIFVPAFARYPRLFFFAFDLPILFVCGYFASKPIRNRDVSFAHGVLLLVVMPFLIWVALIFGLFGLGALLASIAG
jgi:hypothetical protein